MIPLARSVVALAAVLSVGLVAGCSTGDAEPGEAGITIAEPSEDGAEDTPPDNPPDSQPDPDNAQPDADTTACDEVVAGIDAFNAGDFDETVAAFERAVPLAEAEDAAAGTARSADLLEAVEYYAALPAEDYPAASLSSPDFARYKAITLGQCASSQPPAGSDDGGVLA